MRRNSCCTLLWICLFLFSSITITNANANERDEKSHQQQQNPLEWFRNYTTSKFKTNFNTTKLSSTVSNIDFKGFTSRMITSPKVSKFGYGVVMGYSSGICVKKISKTAAVLVGGFFMVIQYLSSHGYLHVDHQRIRQDFETVFDFNKDGEVNSSDVKAFIVKMRDFLSNGIPEGGGFTTGFVMGLRA